MEIEWSELRTHLTAPDDHPPRFFYENDHLMFSAIRERKLTLVWKAWATRCVRIGQDGTLSYAWPKLALKDPKNDHVPKHKQFLLEKVEVSLMKDGEVSHSDKVDYGLVVKCQTTDHIDTYFRCIISEEDLEPFLQAMKQAAKEHNIDHLPKSELTVRKTKQTFFILRSKQSVMRRAVTRAMDRYDVRSKRDRILAKRGAFKYLPVMLANDLIHGSWSA
jgi:hypothetical protein